MKSDGLLQMSLTLSLALWSDKVFVAWDNPLFIDYFKNGNQADSPSQQRTISLVF